MKKIPWYALLASAAVILPAAAAPVFADEQAPEAASEPAPVVEEATPQAATPNATAGESGQAAEAAPAAETKAEPEAAAVADAAPIVEETKPIAEVPAVEAEPDPAPAPEKGTAGSIAEAPTVDAEAKEEVYEPDAADKTALKTEAPNVADKNVEAAADKGIVNNFVDVPTGQWYSDWIKQVDDRGLMTGLNPTHFGPETNITRAMVAEILYRMEGSPDVTYNGRFTDVAKDQWYTQAVTWASDVEVVRGYGGGKYFGPNDDIKREDFAVMITNYMRSLGVDTKVTQSLSKFKDAASVSDYARPSMEYVVANKIITGAFDSTMLLPQDPATRAQTAKMVLVTDDLQDEVQKNNVKITAKLDVAPNDFNPALFVNAILKENGKPAIDTTLDNNSVASWSSVLINSGWFEQPKSEADIRPGSYFSYDTTSMPGGTVDNGSLVLVLTGTGKETHDFIQTGMYKNEETLITARGQIAWNGNENSASYKYTNAGIDGTYTISNKKYKGWAVPTDEFYALMHDLAVKNRKVSINGVGTLTFETVKATTPEKPTPTPTPTPTPDTKTDVTINMNLTDKSNNFSVAYFVNGILAANGKSAVSFAGENCDNLAEGLIKTGYFKKATSAADIRPGSYFSYNHSSYAPSFPTNAVMFVTSGMGKSGSTVKHNYYQTGVLYPDNKISSMEGQIWWDGSETSAKFNFGAGKTAYTASNQKYLGWAVPTDEFYGYIVNAAKKGTKLTKYPDGTITFKVNSTTTTPSQPTTPTTPVKNQKISIDMGLQTANNGMDCVEFVNGVLKASGQKTISLTVGDACGGVSQALIKSGYFKKATSAADICPGSIFSYNRSNISAGSNVACMTVISGYGQKGKNVHHDFYSTGLRLNNGTIGGAVGEVWWDGKNDQAKYKYLGGSGNTYTASNSKYDGWAVPTDKFYGYMVDLAKKGKAITNSPDGRITFKLI